MSPTIRQLLERSEKDLKTIRRLIDSEDLEMALSRIYYVMFYLAEAMLLTEGKSFSSHAAVISAFGKDFIRAGKLPKQLHQHLRQAQDKRLASDYNMPGNFTREEAEEQLRHAQEFLGIIRPFLEGSE